MQDEPAEAIVREWGIVHVPRSSSDFIFWGPVWGPASGVLRSPSMWRALDPKGPKPKPLLLGTNAQEGSFFVALGKHGPNPKPNPNPNPNHHPNPNPNPGPKPNPNPVRWQRLASSFLAWATSPQSALTLTLTLTLSLALTGGSVWLRASSPGLPHNGRSNV